VRKETSSSGDADVPVVQYAIYNPYGAPEQLCPAGHRCIGPVSDDVGFRYMVWKDHFNFGKSLAFAVRKTAKEEKNPYRKPRWNDLHKEVRAGKFGSGQIDWQLLSTSRHCQELLTMLRDDVAYMDKKFNHPVEPDSNGGGCESSAEDITPSRTPLSQATPELIVSRDDASKPIDDRIEATTKWLAYPFGEAASLVRRRNGLRSLRLTFEGDYLWSAHGSECHIATQCFIRTLVTLKACADSLARTSVSGVRVGEYPRHGIPHNRARRFASRTLGTLNPTTGTTGSWARSNIALWRRLGYCQLIRHALGRGRPPRRGGR
jgi:hypothetical protein